MRFALWTVLLNTALGASLFFWFRSQGWDGFPGLAMATSFSAWMNAAMLVFGLRARGWYHPGRRLILRRLSVTLASLAMGGALYYLLQNPDLIQNRIAYGKFVEVLVFILIGGLIYGLAALVFGAIRLSDLKGLRRRA